MRSFLLMLAIAGGGYATEPVPAEQAHLEGPKILVPGQYFRVSAKGSTGADPKLELHPKVDTTDVVTYGDGQFGLVGTIQKPGRYFVVLANNKENKTAVAVLMIEVQGEPDPVDMLQDNLTLAYAKDNKPAEQKAYLTALYKRMATEKVATWVELETLLAKSCKSVFPDDSVLRAVRNEAAAYLVKSTGKLDGPIDTVKQAAVFNKLADTLQKVN